MLISTSDLITMLTVKCSRYMYAISNHELAFKLPWSPSPNHQSQGIKQCPHSPSVLFAISSFFLMLSVKTGLLSIHSVGRSVNSHAVSWTLTLIWYTKTTSNEPKMTYKYKTIKLVEENIMTLCDFLDIMPKAQKKKQKNWTISKFITLCVKGHNIE